MWFQFTITFDNLQEEYADLLDRLSTEYPEMRFRYTSPHPKDFPDELLYIMRDRYNICKNIHLPAQTGSSTVLERMRRGYTREAYLDLVQKIRSIIPDVGLSSDFICGKCQFSNVFSYAVGSMMQHKLCLKYITAQKR